MLWLNGVVVCLLQSKPVLIQLKLERVWNSAQVSSTMHDITDPGINTDKPNRERVMKRTEKLIGEIWRRLRISDVAWKIIQSTFGALYQLNIRSYKKSRERTKENAMIILFRQQQLRLIRFLVAEQRKQPKWKAGEMKGNSLRSNFVCRLCSVFILLLTSCSCFDIFSYGSFNVFFPSRLD